jgi:RHS repeat-associated protein
MYLVATYSVNSEIQRILIQTMNGRMYDPVIGRVLSPDIAIQAPGYTQSYNRYSYCMNNPLRYTDPSGWYVMLSNGHKVGQDFNDWGVGTSANLYMPGGGSGYAYNSATDDYTLNGEIVSYWQVHNDVIAPMSSYSLTGPAAGELVSRVLAGFSLYSYNLNGHQNLVLSIGDPKLVPNTDGDGGYFTLNPTAGSYLYGTLAISVGKEGVILPLINDNVNTAINIPSTVVSGAASMTANEIIRDLGVISEDAKYLKIGGNLVAGAAVMLSAYNFTAKSINGKVNTSDVVDLTASSSLAILGIMCSNPITLGVITGVAITYGVLRIVKGDEADKIINDKFGFNN